MGCHESKINPSEIPESYFKAIRMNPESECRSKLESKSKINPLGIPDSCFKAVGMNPEKNVLFFKVTLQDRSYRPIKIDMLKADSTAWTGYCRDAVPGIENGCYFYVKNEGYTKVQDNHHLEELFKQLDVKIPRYKVEVIYDPNRKPKLPA